jgi:hypothetical protein
VPPLDFCDRPARAADAGHDVGPLVRRPVTPTNALRREAQRGATLLRQGGIRLVGARVVARARRLPREHRTYS